MYMYMYTYNVGSLVPRPLPAISMSHIEKAESGLDMRLHIRVGTVILIRVHVLVSLNVHYFRTCIDSSSDRCQ